MPGHNKGFTLIELMVTIAIAAILITAGVPAFNQFVKENRLTTQVNALVHAFNIARSEAIRQRTSVGICAADTTVTPLTCGTDWTKGWVVYADEDGDSAIDSAEVISVFPSISGGNTLAATLATSPLAYQASGLSTTCGYFKVADQSDASLAKWVIVSPTGSIRTSNTNDSTCP